MKQLLIWMLAAIMILCGASLQTSCNEYDDDVVPVNERISGKWYAEDNTPGTYKVGDQSIKYEKIAQYGYLHDGTGFWSVIFVDAAGHAIDIPGCRVTLEVPEEELARRRAAWVCPEPKVKTGYLARYAKLVSSADKGAILN